MMWLRLAYGVRCVRILFAAALEVFEVVLPSYLSIVCCMFVLREGRSRPMVGSFLMIARCVGVGSGSG